MLPFKCQFSSVNILKGRTVVQKAGLRLFTADACIVPEGTSVGFVVNKGTPCQPFIILFLLRFSL